LNKSKTVDKGISDIVGVFTDPIVVFPGGWGDTLPDWLKNAVTLERLEMNMKALKGEEMTGTDVEACAYLYTASLTQPMGHDWTQIYLYVAGRVHSRWNKGAMPEDINVESMTDYQTRELNRLKEWLCRKRVLARQDRERAERRAKKEEKAVRRESDQPALFGF
jgi:hypothetical protein